MLYRLLDLQKGNVFQRYKLVLLSAHMYPNAFHRTVLTMQP